MWKGFDTERALKQQTSMFNAEEDHCDRESHKARRNSKEKRKIRFSLPETEAVPSHNDESCSGEFIWPCSHDTGFISYRITDRPSVSFLRSQTIPL